MNHSQKILSAVAVAAIIIAIIIAIVVIMLTKKDNDEKTVSSQESTWAAVGDGVTGNSNGSILHSTNGTVWAESTGKYFGANKGYGIAYGKGTGDNPLWVAVGDSAAVTPQRNAILHSTDGTVWEESTGISFKKGVGRGVAYGKGTGDNLLWVATGDADGANPSLNAILYSTNGTCWAESTGISFTKGYGYEAAYGKGAGNSSLWVAAGAAGVGSSWNALLNSTDGIDWEESTGISFKEAAATGVAYGKDGGGSPVWVATGHADGANPSLNAILYSTNGTCWVESTGVSFKIGRGKGIAYGKGSGNSSLWVAVGTGIVADKGNAILYSTNGRVWKQSEGVSFKGHVGIGIEYGKESDGSPLWVATGHAGTGSSWNAILNSKDGITWEESTGVSFEGIGNGAAADHLLYGMDTSYYT